MCLGLAALADGCMSAPTIHRTHANLPLPPLSSPRVQIGFLGPAFFLTRLGGITTVKGAVACMMAAQGLDAFSQSGLYSNHADIGPQYAGVLLGLSNTAGVLAGVLGTAATGFILQNGSWSQVRRRLGSLGWGGLGTGLHAGLSGSLPAAPRILLRARMPCHTADNVHRRPDPLPAHPRVCAGVGRGCGSLPGRHGGVEPVCHWREGLLS